VVEVANRPPSVVVVDTVARTLLGVAADTPHWIVLVGLHSGGAVPKEPISAAAFAVGLALVLQINKKYGALLLSRPMADHVMLSPELVGVLVEESGAS
jgi:hypothetical protein